MIDQGPLRIAIVRCGPLKQQHHITTLCQFLAGSGLSIEFVSLQAPASDVRWFSEQVRGIRVHTVGELKSGKYRRFFHGGMELRRKLRELRFDVLYIVDSWTIPYVLVATLGRVKWGYLPTVYHTFDMITAAGHSRMYFALEGFFARRSQLVVNTDRSRAEVARMAFKLRRTPISVPLRLLRDTVLPQRDVELRQVMLGLTSSEDRVMVIYPTTLGAHRLSKEVISSFAELPERYHLITIDGDGPYAQECREIVREIGVGERVHILNPMSHDDVLKLCASADVGLIFHDVDAGIGNYFCHPGRLAYYVALGLPLVASNVPALEAVVYRYGLGLCCSPYRPSAIAAAIRELCEGHVSLAMRSQRMLEAFRLDLHYEREANVLVDSIRGLVQC